MSPTKNTDSKGLVKFSEVEQRKAILKELERRLATFGNPNQRGTSTARAGANLTIGKTTFKLDISKVLVEDGFGLHPIYTLEVRGSSNTY